MKSIRTCDEISGEPTEVVLGDPLQDGEESDEVVPDEMDDVELPLLEVVDGGDDVNVGILIGSNHAFGEVLDPRVHHWNDGRNGKRGGGEGWDNRTEEEVFTVSLSTHTTELVPYEG